MPTTDIIVVTVIKEIASGEIRFQDNRRTLGSLAPGRQLPLIHDSGDEILVATSSSNTSDNAWIPKNKVSFPEL